MRVALIGLAAVAVCASGCYFPSQKFAEEETRYNRFLNSPAALYCLASHLDYDEKASGIEMDAAEQKRLVGQLGVEAMRVFGDAGRIRFNRSIPPVIREAEALNMEGDARRMREELANRRELVGVLETSSAWYRQQSHRESMRIDQIVHNDIPTR